MGSPLRTGTTRLTLRFDVRALVLTQSSLQNSSCQHGSWRVVVCAERRGRPTLSWRPTGCNCHCGERVFYLELWHRLKDHLRESTSDRLIADVVDKLVLDAANDAWPKCVEHARTSVLTPLLPTGASHLTSDRRTHRISESAEGDGARLRSLFSRLYRALRLTNGRVVGDSQLEELVASSILFMPEIATARTLDVNSEPIIAAALDRIGAMRVALVDGTGAPDPGHASLLDDIRRASRTERGDYAELALAWWFQRRCIVESRGDHEMPMVRASTLLTPFLPKGFRWPSRLSTATFASTALSTATPARLTSALTCYARSKTAFCWG